MTASSTPDTRSEQPADPEHTERRRHARAWVVLLIAGLFEIGYAVGVGGSQGFTVLDWSIVAAVFFFLTVITLSLALKTIDVGIGYAVWTGIGATGATVVSAIRFGEALTPMRILWLAVIIAGVVGLKLASSPKLAEKSPPAAPQS